jgi:hypothetical protein
LRSASSTSDDVRYADDVTVQRAATTERCSGDPGDGARYAIAVAPDSAQAGDDVENQSFLDGEQRSARCSCSHVSGKDEEQRALAADQAEDSQFTRTG